MNVALWPFSTLGWPEETKDYNMFFPTNVLVTGYDIIFFWVARMIFSSIYSTGKKPFSDILIHGIIRDSQGRKMSKSLGNGIDPIEVIEKYGTDALRFSILSGTTMGNDIRYIPEKLEQASNFANKIWNAAKFITMNLVEDKEILKFSKLVKDEITGKYKKELLKIEDIWILNRLDKTIETVTINIEEYDLGIALDNIYGFIWNEFCDWYIEMAKPRLYSENKEEKVQVCFVLNYVFGSALKLLHPFMPFITSEIYSKLVNYDIKELMISKWPQLGKMMEYNEEKDFIEKIKEIIVGIRNLRNNMNVHPSKKSKLIFVTNEYIKNIEDSETFIKKLGFANEIIIKSNKEDIPQNARSILVKGIEVFIPFEELIDIKLEIQRLENEKVKLEQEVKRATNILKNEGFISKAPKQKIKDEQQKLEKYKELLEITIQRIEELK